MGVIKKEKELLDGVTPLMSECSYHETFTDYTHCVQELFEVDEIEYIFSFLKKEGYNLCSLETYDDNGSRRLELSAYKTRPLTEHEREEMLNDFNRKKRYEQYLRLKKEFEG